MTENKISDESFYELVKPGSDSSWPHWPSEELQRKYTAGSGLQLVGRCRKFINLMRADGQFSSSKWRGLDYGCGWGRLASYLLTEGPAENLDVCDGWQFSLDALGQSNFKNRQFLVPEQLTGPIGSADYDFIYAFSIFTHLQKETFRENIKHLVSSVRTGGKVYFTVRHEEHFEHLRKAGKTSADATFDADGFWGQPQVGSTYYGEAAVTPKFLDSVGAHLGELFYLGTSEPMQHCYRITR